VISFGGGCASEELIENVVCSLLVAKAVQSGLVETICKDFGAADAATVIEMEFEEPTMARGVWIHERFGIAEGIYQRREGLDKLSKLCLPLGMSRESQNLLDD